MKCHANLATIQPDTDPYAVVTGPAHSCWDSRLYELAARLRCRAFVAKESRNSDTRVLLWLFITWIAGSSIAETFSWGGETKPVHRTATLNEQSSDSDSISRQWCDIETEIALANSGIESFVRMEENDRFRPTLTKMIESEETLLAMRASIEAIRKAPQHIVVNSDAVVVDPVMDSMHVAKKELTIVYRQLDESRKDLSLTDRSINRLAWDAAQMSAIPGLVRLVAHRDHALMSPVYVQNITVDDPAFLNHTENTSALVEQVIEVSASGLNDALALERVNSTDSAETIAAETKSQPMAASTVPMMPRETAKERTAEVSAIDSIEAKSPSAPEPHLRSDQEVVASNAAHRSDALDQTDESLAPVIIQPPPLIQHVVSEPIVTKRPPAATSPPIAHVAAQWPFVNEQVNSQKVSLNVSNADVRTVFEMLARGYQMNILVSPDVNGTVTANIEGLTAEETLHGILTMCDLKSRYEDGLIFIYPGDGLPAESREVRLFPLDFARAQVLEPAVQGLLSPIGNAYITEINTEDNLRSSETIVVVDTPEAIEQIENYILQADCAPRQVMIEAHILEVELSDDITHGVNFEAMLGGDLTVGSFGLADPIASRANPLFFAEIDGSDVKALITILETTTDAKTLASPRVMVVNGQNARIQVGKQLGFTVATVTQTSTIQDVQFLDTGVVLDVTPTISRDNTVMMQVKPQVSDGQINPDTLLPEQETRELQTSVMVDNHRGIVIGGLIQESERTVIQKLPWLGDVSYVGKLFQRREATRKRTEIIIALVPHIVECGIDSERDAVEYDRATNPLFHGPLRRTCRPWEPRLPDVVGDERCLDVNRVNRVISH